MDKFHWAKYIFSFWIVAITAALTAKYITSNTIVLVILSASLFLLLIKGFSSTKAYR
ncbi:hypothetical protein [Dyadobacter sp. 50-39]|uniref:hypothetical protein n=1 Tax=Dyadobacter sp. 50-39 TaxID=1895756 RepID=UPI0025B9343D|nr:hypothetical protein [Dyadobacter sp. 50-39]